MGLSPQPAPRVAEEVTPGTYLRKRDLATVREEGVPDPFLEWTEPSQSGNRIV